jgi:hypothetical protein
VRAFVVTVIVLTLAALGADRVAERVATDRAETRLAAAGLSSPKVDVAGFPFLTQLLQRRLGEVTVTSPRLEVGSGTAHDVEVTGDDVDLPQEGHATVGHLRGNALVSYDEVLARAGAERGIELSPAEDGQVRMRGDAVVLGRRVPVTAVARVEATGRTIRLEPREISVDGAGVGGAITASVEDRFTLTYRLASLPDGLQVEDVTAERTGFRVHVVGRDVTVSTDG